MIDYILKCLTKLEVVATLLGTRVETPGGVRRISVSQ